MKIVHCIFTMKMGGAQVLTVDILNELCIRHQVALIVINDQYSETLIQQLDKRVTVYYTNRKEGSRNPIPVLHLNLLLAQLRPDIIHCHERKMARLVRYRGAKTIYTIHTVNIPADSFHRYNALVAISDAVATDVQNRCESPVITVCNGVPFNQFIRRTSHAIAPEETIQIVQVGRLMHEQKGQDILLRALAVLVHERQLHDLHVTLVGDGPSRQLLIALVRQLAIEPFVTFSGERDRKWLFGHLSAYHILAQPSRQEGFGLTVVEGFAAGLPVVASNHDGPAEIIGDAPAGLLFACEDANACADALLDMINAYRCGQVANSIDETYSTIRKRFSIQATVENYLSVYHSLTTSKRPMQQFPVLSPPLYQPS